MRLGTGGAHEARPVTVMLLRQGCSLAGSAAAASARLLRFMNVASLRVGNLCDSQPAVVRKPKLKRVCENVICAARDYRRGWYERCI